MTLKSAGDPTATDELQILIVEDVALEAEIAARHLRKQGIQCHVHCVATEVEFLRALSEHPPHLILSDYTLPDFDGVRALNLAMAHAPDVPFIFVSGTIGEERAIDALRRGATDYVLKDNLARLGPAVERALREVRFRIAKRDAENMLRDIVATSQDWIWQLDRDGRFTFCSPAVFKILGYRPEAMLGQRFDRYLDEEFAVSVDSLLPVLSGTKSTLTGVAARWRHADGQFRWLERNAISLHDDQGRPIGYRGIDRDITQRREQQTRIQRLSRSHRMLSSINSAILRVRGRADLFQEACRIAVDQGGYDRAMVSQVDPVAGELRAVAWSGARSEFLERSVTSLQVAPSDPFDMNLQALLSGVAMVSDDLSQVAAQSAFKNAMLDLGFRSCVVLPLAVDHTPIGTLMLNSTQTSMLDTAELRVLQELAANIGYALQYFDKEDAVQFLSYFDSVTGLAKRSLFCDRFARSLAATTGADASGAAASGAVASGAVGSTVAVVVFDVQRLSLVNDSLGRDVGDRLLEQIAERLKNHFGDARSVAHFGGGTFAAFFSDLVDPTQTGRLLHSEAARFFADPFLIEGRELRASIRSGFAYYPDDGRTADTVVQSAEAALTRAKQIGTPYVLHSLMGRDADHGRLALEARLSGAMQRDELLLYYQPQVDIDTRRVVGVEALMRWRDKQQGLVLPGVFIPLLESMGLIVDAGRWAIEQAAKDCRAWRALGAADLRCSVNVSALQLRERDFVERVIAATGAVPGESMPIDLELTESMLMHDLESSTQKFETLRRAGLRIAIDDFGTGYSSLQHLARLPIDTLKIDRSFVQGIVDNPHDRSIVATIIQLAKQFAMSTVAEGVETDEQLSLLREMRCDQAQGYLFSKPVTAAGITQMLREAGYS
jgi:PAS domain S-box-containing protein/diguanylate cyclase (GGDEF)-like protein